MTSLSPSKPGQRHPQKSQKEGRRDQHVDRPVSPPPIRLQRFQQLRLAGFQLSPSGGLLGSELTKGALHAFVPFRQQRQLALELLPGFGQSVATTGNRVVEQRLRHDRSSRDDLLHTLNKWTLVDSHVRSGARLHRGYRSCLQQRVLVAPTAPRVSLGERAKFHVI